MTAETSRARELKTILSKINRSFSGTRQNPTRHRCLTEVGSTGSQEKNVPRLRDPLIAELKT
jgi:hypothetical protein